ncbi:MAG: diaminobutyrate--2-oxoglutarate transaminase [Candidatus Hydrogenedentes bacterium]|nr:diaminobutyrate--2-oxoglutarate transaminase [Candidatus Hydrogenedentota bacterium]
MAIRTRAESTQVFERVESNVRGYCRAYPTVFTRAQNASLFNERGDRFIDFLAGAGTLSYGHNNPHLKKALLEYIAQDGIVHSLDMYSSAKRRFLEALDQIVLRPREMDYCVQFTGPTGTNAVEAALKIARNYTGRTNVIAFTNGFHGVTLGSVAVTGNAHFRSAAGVALCNTTFMPYDGYCGEHVDTIAFIERMLTDPSSGLDFPAAVIVECIQGEGGVNEASFDWLRRLERLCNMHGIVLIVDDIQAGVGRTGTFFSFEDADISPDVITLSKSLSGYGLPLSVVLLKRKLDIWKPGQHNGTFRGNNLAFVTAAEMIGRYWTNRGFSKQVQQKSWYMGKRLHQLRERFPSIVGVRGRGLFFGIEFSPICLAGEVRDAAFRNGLIVETCGARDHVLKILPPLTIEESDMAEGLCILEASLVEALESNESRAPVPMEYES